MDCLQQLECLSQEIKATNNPAVSWRTIRFHRHETACYEFIKKYELCKSQITNNDLQKFNGTLKHAQRVCS